MYSADHSVSTKQKMAILNIFPDDSGVTRSRSKIADVFTSSSASPSPFDTSDRMVDAETTAKLAMRRSFDIPTALNPRKREIVLAEENAREQKGIPPSDCRVVPLAPPAGVAPSDDQGFASHRTVVNVGLKGIGLAGSVG